MQHRGLRRIGDDGDARQVADGVGDLPGITSRLPYLRDLGVDALWITPFYPSPQHDHGYDVADYTDVDPLFGTLADADELLATAHDLGLKVIVDLVPNHTSSEHAWFRAALAAARAATMARYGVCSHAIAGDIGAQLTSRRMGWYAYGEAIGVTSATWGTTAASRLAVWVIPTDEELLIARDTFRAVTGVEGRY